MAVTNSDYTGFGGKRKKRKLEGIINIILLDGYDDVVSAVATL